MATRTTRSEVIAAFDRLCDALHKTPYGWEADGNGKYHAVIGGWVLDENPSYGGYVVTEIMNAGGGVCTPLGETRMPAAQFVRSVRFALDAIEIDRKGR